MSDDLYRLLVIRGYAQHEAHRIAYGPPYLDGSSPEPSANVCPTCHGKGATAPNGVQYCNCPEEAADTDYLLDLLNRAGRRLAAYGSSSMETALLLDEIKMVQLQQPLTKDAKL